MTTAPQQPGYPDYPEYTAMHQLPTPPKKKKRHVLRWIALAVIALAALIIVIALTTAPTPTPTKPAPGNVAADVRTDASTTSGEQAAEPPKAAVKTPTPKDFKLAIKTLKKQCFGSAGCNVTYRIDVTFKGDPLTLDASKTYEVTYDVKGADDPITNTFTLTGGSAQVEQEEYTSTPKSSAKLTAVVTDVNEL